MAITFTNQAMLTVGTEQVLSNVAVGRIEGTLSVTKNAVDAQYSAGETVTFVIGIVNDGDTATVGLTVTDNLGEYAFNTETRRPLTYVDGSLQYYTDGALQTDPAVDTANGLTLTGVSVPANGSAMIVYSARINEFAPLGAGSQIDNTVTVEGANTCEVTDTETITADEGAVLSVTKSITPVPVAENGEVTYTLTLRNTGNTAVTAEENAVITDTFAPVLTGITVTLDGAPLEAAAGYTYDEATGEFATVAGVITVPAATFTQDEITGEFTTAPGVTTLVITGAISTACPNTN